MKKSLLFFLVATLGITLSCSKSSTTPTTIYTIKYLIDVVDSVALDTVQYKDASGVIINKYNLTGLDYSFTSENNYDASLFLTGKIMNGSVVASLEISNASGVLFYNAQGESSSTPQIPMKFAYTLSDKYLVSK